MPKSKLRKKHCILTGSLTCYLLRINFLMQWDYLSDQFSKRQLSKSPKGLLLVNFKSITNPGSVSGQEALTLLVSSGRKQEEKHQLVRSQKHQGASAGSRLFPVLLSYSLNHIDLPATSSFLCRRAQAMLPHHKVSKTRVGKASKTRQLIRTHSLFLLPFALPKQQTRCS